jgi:hypothetical protein
VYAYLFKYFLALPGGPCVFAVAVLADLRLLLRRQVDSGPVALSGALEGC